jgi:hypothetical protein
MRLALLYPEPNLGGARKRGSGSETKTEMKRGGISDARLSQAPAVLAYSRELALAVRDGNGSWPPLKISNQFRGGKP